MHGLDCDCVACMGYDAEPEPEEREVVATCTMCGDPAHADEDLERGHDGETVHAACFDVCAGCGTTIGGDAVWAQYGPTWARLHRLCNGWLDRLAALEHQKAAEMAQEILP